jgi:GntR family transcriptional regulator/MocR family aminotransferase
MYHPAMDGSFGISLDRAGRLSLSEQIADGIRAAIREGRLAPDARLPSWNDLAIQLGVARGTVRSAYERLADGQFIVSAGAAGTRVARRPPATRPEPEPSRGREALGAFQSGPIRPAPFQVGVPAADLFPTALWSRMLAQAARDTASAPVGYPDPRGEAGLRAEIAGYLAVARGFACHPTQVFVTNGYAGAFNIAMRALKLHGAQAWVEDPGYPFARTALAWAGLSAVPVPVDGEGLDVAAGVASGPGARVGVITAGQQAPLGVTLSLERRHALLDWAIEGDRWIIEDDYLGELQLARRAAPALASMDGRRVIHIGTFSKTMSPALRVGYMVVPHDLIGPVAEVVGTLDPAPSPSVQVAIEAYMRDGHYLRHLRRMKRAYAERRDALGAALDSFGVVHEAAALSVLMALPDGTDDVVVAQAAFAEGLSPVPLSPWYGGQATPRSGLLLGVTNVPIEHALSFAERLWRIVQRHAA